MPDSQDVCLQIVYWSIHSCFQVLSFPPAGKAAKRQSQRSGKEGVQREQPSGAGPGAAVAPARAKPCPTHLALRRPSGPPPAVAGMS